MPGCRLIQGPIAQYRLTPRTAIIQLATRRMNLPDRAVKITAITNVYPRVRDRLGGKNVGF